MTEVINKTEVVCEFYTELYFIALALFSEGNELSCQYVTLLTWKLFLFGFLSFFSDWRFTCTRTEKITLRETAQSIR